MRYLVTIKEIKDPNWYATPIEKEVFRQEFCLLDVRQAVIAINEAAINSEQDGMNLGPIKLPNLTPTHQ